MTSFRNPKSRAKFLVNKKSRIGTSRHSLKKEGGSVNLITSLGTKQKTMSCIRQLLQYLRENKIRESEVTPVIVEQFLEHKSKNCVQKTLNGYRQAISKIFDMKVPFVVSQRDSLLTPRAYNQTQISILARSAPPELSLSIRIAAAAGLRAHELDTICRTSDLDESLRDWLPERFFGKGFEKKYVVIGKGGLRRLIGLSADLADELENARLDSQVTTKSRGIFYNKFYHIPGGQRFSILFTRLSKKHFGWSTGSHGLRHRFAQDRIRALQKTGFTYEYSLKIVSNELGHFSTKNTLTYMR